MQTGYRHVRLLSNTGDPIENCCLFVHVAITNKRGGGKGHKRGMSVKKTKRKRDYTSMKAIGVKSIDETFKVAIQPLRDGTDLRDNFRRYPKLEADGNLPEILKKALLAFDTMVNECRALIEHAGHVYERLLQSQRAGLEWHEELESTSLQAGLKGKKLTKAIENFAWNIRVLQGQADLLLQAKKECQEYIRQISEAAVTLGLAKNANTICNNNLTN
ncbi:inactive phospholipase C-like protein 2 [Ruditapes philippinarum]|uniref:inactive phospholipase C-like protein 2 n=1 Tax=Ruditapes philippinarum TaxID=129788 RepID=UPI00295B8F8A|nr:inactive phospholipase C-like protein 2 [Ruditapes philippinarum]